VLQVFKTLTHGSGLQWPAATQSTVSVAMSSSYAAASHGLAVVASAAALAPPAAMLAATAEDLLMAVPSLL